MQVGRRTVRKMKGKYRLWNHIMYACQKENLRGKEISNMSNISSIGDYWTPNPASEGECKMGNVNPLFPLLISALLCLLGEPLTVL